MFIRNELDKYTVEQLMKITDYLGIKIDSKAPKRVYIDRIIDYYGGVSYSTLVESEPPNSQKSVRVQRIYDRSKENG